MRIALVAAPEPAKRIAAVPARIEHKGQERVEAGAGSQHEQADDPRAI